jgi:hypothetical protein
MSPKKQILRELTTRPHLHPSDLPGYAGSAERYQAAVNELLRERLIEGRSDGDGRMSITLNAQRLADVRRALRPAWARPLFWLVTAVVVVVGVGLAV